MPLPPHRWQVGATVDLVAEARGEVVVMAWPQMVFVYTLCIRRPRPAGVETESFLKACPWARRP